jgi:hypothetical protein
MEASFVAIQGVCLQSLKSGEQLIPAFLQMAANITQEHPQRQQEDCESILEHFLKLPILTV